MSSGQITFDLQKWSEGHRDAFAEMQRDPVVMADLGGPFDRAASDAKLIAIATRGAPTAFRDGRLSIARVALPVMRGL